jgi:hypothetical protein
MRDTSRRVWMANGCGVAVAVVGVMGEAGRFLWWWWWC